MVKLNVVCRFHLCPASFFYYAIDWALKNDDWISNLNLDVLKLEAEHSFPIESRH